MKLRAATHADVGAICAIWNAVIETTDITFTTEPKTEDVLHARIHSGNEPLFVATDAASLLGFAGWGSFRTGPGYAHVVEHTIYLSEEARGQGVGSKLMAYLEDRAREANLLQLIAGISGNNEAGIKFHESIGFQHAGHLVDVGRKFGRDLDLVLMQKTL